MLIYHSSVPHPSDNFIMMRIQMYGALRFQLNILAFDASVLDDLSSLTALINALSDLDQLFGSIDVAYFASLEHDKYEQWQEKT
jgi:DNA-directed RNA polymerase I and III subunit RPAC2